ncbi:MAG: GNAT family N-acetyltransferase [Candidatus Velamenicoccus archaeovorus]
MDLRIRTIGPDEFEAYGRTLETAFGSHLRPGDLERERTVAELDRCLAAFDGDEMVGGASAVSFTMTVPGGEVRTAGITGVGVKPTHRRLGINSALMRRQLDDVHAGSEPVAALYASEGSIYGRFGYALATYRGVIDVERERTAFVRGYHPSGRVRLLERNLALERFLPIHDHVRRERPGMMAMDPTWFAYRFDERHHGDERPRFYAAHQTGEAIDGFAVYHVKHEWQEERRNELAVDELVALTPQAYADLWRYVFDVDLMDRFTAWNRPFDEPLLHLLREPDRLRFRLGDGLWVRLVDVPAALEARRYAAPGRVVIEVADPFCPWNEGRYELEGGPDGASCRPTQGGPDLALTVNELGACYLGGMGFRQLARAGRVEELRPGALARADAMFAWDPAPWCSFVF